MDGGEAVDDPRWRSWSTLVARLQFELDLERERRTAQAVVELAKGVLMERLRCSPAEAAAQLARLAGQTGVPVRELALDLVDQTALDDIAHSDLPVSRRREARLAQVEAHTAAGGGDVAAVVFDQMLAGTGAQSVALWALEPDGSLGLVGHAGLSSLDASRWSRVPPQFDSLPLRVLHDAAAQWWPRGIPPGEPVPTAGSRAAARALLPMTDTGTLVGVMEVCWPESVAEFDVVLRRQLLAAAQVAVQALFLHGDPSRDQRAHWLPALLDGLFESGMLARAVRDPAGDLVDLHVDHLTQDFLDPAGRSRAELLDRRFLTLYPLTATPGGLFEHLRQAMAAEKPFYARQFPIHVLVEGAVKAVNLEVRAVGLFDGIVVGWRATDHSAQLRALLENAEKLGQLGGWEQDLVTGEVLWTDNAHAVFHRPRPQPPIRLEELDGHAHPEDAERVRMFRDSLVRLGRPAVSAFRLMHSDGSTRSIRAFGEPVTAADGTRTAVRGAYQDITAAYGAHVALAAIRDRLAEAERLSEDRQRIALRLQQAIIATSAPLPRSARLDIAVRYRPAEQDDLVGGDWYSAVTMPTGDVLLVVGDVAGHGIDAVTAMVNLRYSLRGLAVTGAGPAQLLGWLNTITHHLTDQVTGTAICGRYDPLTRTLRWSQAGHLPPVLLRDGRARHLPVPEGILLGVVDDAEYEERTTVLERDDILLMFTDGLVERRGTSLDESMEALFRLAERQVDDVEAYADHLLAGAASDTDDDTCLIAVHIR
ncbi:SpoIIE family protein phosphatase [Parafrankia sp. EUN1f]|uniref:SpoIIE family protein phosphatase n=1 Tax=Parafrankia sp. EUN1f TaxID=102897 RepID=UPI0001C43EA7|nr:SpoIIE family protein phosphatase [Parafrankia sp. EUN1f]EFC84518.1 putative PAS/PAC sensor protein [Parafrankia sp. EUN1f]